MKRLTSPADLMHLLTLAFTLAMTLVCSAARAQSTDAPVSTIEVERARIASERSAIESNYLAEEKACYLRFSVTECLKDARARRRTTLADLHRQELSLSDAERKARGAEHQKKIEEKAADKQDQEADKRARAIDEQRIREEKAVKKAEATGDFEAAAKSRVQARLGRQQSASDKAASRAARAASTPAFVGKHDEKIRQAAEHREQLEKKIRERSKPPSKLLPLPPGAS
jgi:colicin import membrane protein